MGAFDDLKRMAMNTLNGVKREFTSRTGRNLSGNLLNRFTGGQAGPAAAGQMSTDNPFTDQTPEQELRSQIRQALADGQLTETEKDELLRLCDELNISRSAAAQMFEEEKNK